MCGRYTLSNSGFLRQEMEAITGLSFEEFAPRYNVAPSQLNPIVCEDADGKRQVRRMRWGMVPFWEKSEKPKIAPINARSEEAFSKPTFKRSIQQRRCIIPADGFYEWKRGPGDHKQPYHIRLKGGQPFFFAGIYEAATDIHPETFLLFTTLPNSLMEDIHDRMPAILQRHLIDPWLASGAISEADLGAMTSSYPADQMEAVPVSPIVNNPRNESPDCLVPITP